MSRRLPILLTAFSLCFGACGFAQEPIVLQKPDPKKPKDSISYSMGWVMGQNLLGNGFLESDLAFDDFLSGVKDALSKGKCKLDENEMTGAMQSLDAKMRKRAQDVAQSNADAAAKFLEENKKKDGVQTTPSGLQYKVIKSGNGTKSPSMTSVIKVHYEGKLRDGTVFDSSIKRNEPIEYPLQQMIKGWIEALQRMKIGDKWQLWVPPSLGYGLEGMAPANIGPNELLIFEVELLDVK